MTQTKEEKKEYQREYHRLYRIKKKEENKDYMKLRYLKEKKRNKEYIKTDKGSKVCRIFDWKRRGILCFDFDLLNDLFLSTTKCEFCNCKLDTNTKSRKCLDHDHSITDKFNIRAVLCMSCNIKDVLKTRT